MSDLTAAYGKLDWGEWRRCDGCGHWDFANRHRCLPDYEVADRPDADERVAMHADGPEAAAARFAQDHDLIFGRTAQQLVYVWCPVLSGAPKAYFVRAHGRWSYWVEETILEKGNGDGQ